MMKSNQEFNINGQAAVKPFSLRSSIVYRSPKLIAVLMIALCSVLLASCKNSGSEAAGEVAAKIGSHEITLKDIDRVIKQQIDQSGRSGASLTSAELANARLSVLDNLVREESLFQKAQRENLVPDDNKISEEIQRRIQEARLSKEQYDEQLKASGLTEAEWRERIKKDLAIKALNDRVTKNIEPPTTAEIEKYYNDNRGSFIADRGADISVIFADPADNGIPTDAVGTAAAEQKIKAVYEQLKGGMDFATVAAQRSEDASAVRGGALGFNSEARLRQMFGTRQEVVQRIMSMTPGQYTEPISEPTAGAWVIVKLNDKLEAPRNLSLEQVRQNIVDTITQQRQTVLLNALVLVATQEAEIENYLADRFLKNPKTIVELRPSELLQQSGGQQPQQPQPRIENQNQSASPAPPANSPATGNANRAGASNANRSGGSGNGNSSPASPNANR